MSCERPLPEATSSSIRVSRTPAKDNACADTSTDCENSNKRMYLRKPNLESIFNQGNSGVSAEIISMRKQIFQRPSNSVQPNPVDSDRQYVRSNSIDSSSPNIKILNTGRKSSKVVPSSPSSTDRVQQSTPPIVMRRTLSGDCMESKDKSQCKSKLASCQEENSSLHSQVSDLVRNAEIKKAEIVSLKMEVNRLMESKDSSSDKVIAQLKKDMEVLQKENRMLRERLDEFERSGPIAIASTTSASESEIKSSDQGNNAPATNDAIDGGVKPSTTSCLTEESPNSREWDKTSSSSMSEISVACLQDRITQMEETHYSTNEELQATLQELSDLQEQVNILHMENEQLETDKAVLYESLCSQTERLEDTRNQVTRLKELLFHHENSAQANDAPVAVAVASPTSGTQNGQTASEREAHLIELLKSAQQEYEDLVMKKDELAETVDESKAKMAEIEHELENALVSMKELENKLTKISDEKKHAEQALSEGQKAYSALKLEMDLLQTQLHREQVKVKELLREREARASSELDILLREMQTEKDKIEARAVNLQEQLAISQLESMKLNDRLKKAELDLEQCKISYEKERSDLLLKLTLESSEKECRNKELERLESATREAELKCIRHLEDKRELKATISEMQKQLQEERSKLHQLSLELAETKEKFKEEYQEWQLFKSDLLTTVRVANEFKTEAQEMVERILLKNKKLSERIPQLEAEVAKLKAQADAASASVKQDQSPVETVPPVVPAVVASVPRRSVSVSPVIFSPNGNAPTVLRSKSVEPATTPVISVNRDIAIPRKSIAMWMNSRPNHMSVKSLIESIEKNKHHQSKYQSTDNANASSTMSTPITSCNTSPSIDSCREQRTAQTLLSSSSPLPHQPLEQAKSELTTSPPKSLPLSGKKLGRSAVR